MIVIQSEFARMRGVSREAINDWVKRGVITLTPEGHVDTEAALAAIEAAHDPARAQKVLISGPAPTMLEAELPAARKAPPELDSAPPPTDLEQRSFHIAKTRREFAEAERAELRLSIERGELIDVDKAMAAWQNIFATTRAKVLVVATLPEWPEHLRPLLLARLTDALQDMATHDPRELVEIA